MEINKLNFISNDYHVYIEELGRTNLINLRMKHLTIYFSVGHVVGRRGDLQTNFDFFLKGLFRCTWVA